MEPHTAKNLKERKQNKLKDFIHVAGPLGARAVRLYATRCSFAARSRRP
jgi:ribosome biogenesis protein SSF1/2